MKLNEVLTKTINFFKDKKIESYRLDAELLIAHALKKPRISLYLDYEKPLSEEEVSLCREYVKRRSQGEPVAYIIGEKGFFGHIFQVLPGVLIPRPETEILVETVIEFCKQKQLTLPRFLDMGSGTGCIGLTLLKEISDSQLVSIEMSEIAQKNTELNRLKMNLIDRCDLIKSKVEDVQFEKLGAFDCIVSNPPYIDHEDNQVEENVRKYEPATALFAENKGLSFLQNWSKLTKDSLGKPGLMIFEMGYQQGQPMKKFFEDLAFFDEVKVIQDLSGLDRFIVGYRHG